jgi:hypothetical protein
MHNNSEIARLRKQIEQEHAACVWAVTGLAVDSAKHLFIQRRMERMGSAHQSLIKLLGEEQATAIVCEIVDRIPPSKAGVGCISRKEEN